MNGRVVFVGPGGQDLAQALGMGGGGGGAPAPAAGGAPVAGGPDANPLNTVLQMGLRAAFGGLQQQPGQGPDVRVMPQMPAMFAQMGGQPGQWESFVREAMDAQGGADRPHPASDAAIAKMRKGTCKEGDEGGDRPSEPCPVCQDEFADGDDWIQMPCKHFYHADCLTPWLKEHNTCPTCREAVEEAEPEVAAPSPAPPPQQPQQQPPQQQAPPGMFPPGMFAQGGQEPQVGDVMEALLGQGGLRQGGQAQQAQAQAQANWEQWLGRLDHSLQQRRANGRGPDLRPFFSGMRSQNMERVMEEEERQLQAAMAASMETGAEEDERRRQSDADAWSGLSREEVAALSVRELKRLLDSRGQDHTHCLERSELLELALAGQVHHAQAAGAAEDDAAAREAAELEEAIRLSLAGTAI